MADDWTIAVKALWDGTSLETGSAEAAASLDKLGTAVETTSTDVTSSLAKMGTAAETEFGTTLPNAVDTAIDGPVGLTTKAGKFKAVGTELGETVAQGVGSGLTGAEQLANIGTSVTSLLAPFAATGAGAVAAIGLGAGAALVTNLIKGAQERRQEFTDNVNEIFDNIEVHAKDSMADIRRSIVETFTFKSVLEDLGGEEGLAGGVEKVNDLVKETGASFNEIVEILRGQINPSNRDTLEILRNQSKEHEDLARGMEKYSTTLSGTAKTAGEILDTSRANKDEIQGSAEAARRYRDYQRDTLPTQRENAAQAERNAAAQERAAAAAERQAAALERINRRNDGDKVQ